MAKRIRKTTSERLAQVQGTVLRWNRKNKLAQTMLAKAIGEVGRLSRKLAQEQTAAMNDAAAAVAAVIDAPCPNCELPRKECKCRASEKAMAATAKRKPTKGSSPRSNRRAITRRPN